MMDLFKETMSIDVLLGDLGLPIQFISWEDEIEALLDSLPPESPPNSHSNPDADDALPNLTVKLQANGVNRVEMKANKRVRFQKFPSKFPDPNITNAYPDQFH
ncbi:unnamed protein product [Allacma fusca]|uniref:Uncharacterized protein n=1 Tax=Allacma fusca TaxID=39272 RepID=A0A8J2LHN5_9HEXA|nr:unnamed protein product [Allacma fusca]